MSDDMYTKHKLILDSARERQRHAYLDEVRGGNLTEYKRTMEQIHFDEESYWFLKGKAACRMLDIPNSHILYALAKRQGDLETMQNAARCVIINYRMFRRYARIARRDYKKFDHCNFSGLANGTCPAGYVFEMAITLAELKHDIKMVCNINYLK